MPPWITLTISVATGISALTGAAVGLRKLVPILRAFFAFINDVAGEPARPGVPARPGLVESVSLLRADVSEVRATQATQGEKLTAVEKSLTRQGEALAAQGEKVDKVHHELHPNSGMSVRDAIDRLERAAGIKPPTKPGEAPVVPEYQRPAQRARSRGAKTTTAVVVEVEP